MSNWFSVLSFKCCFFLNWRLKLQTVFGKWNEREQYLTEFSETGLNVLRVVHYYRPGLASVVTCDFATSYNNRRINLILFNDSCCILDIVHIPIIFGSGQNHSTTNQDCIVKNSAITTTAVIQQVSKSTFAFCLLFLHPVKASVFQSLR